MLACEGNINNNYRFPTDRFKFHFFISILLRLPRSSRRSHHKCFCLKSSSSSPVTGPSPSSHPVDIVMHGFKPRCCVHLCRLCLVMEEIEQQWGFLIFFNTCPPTFGYSQVGPIFSKCANSFTNQRQTFTFYISNSLRIVQNLRYFSLAQ